MGNRFALYLAAGGSTLLALTGVAHAQAGGGGGKLVGVGTTDTAEPAPAPAPAPAARGAAVYAPRAERFPVPYVDRGITNPAGIFSPSLQFDFLRPEILGGAGGGFGFGGNPDTIGFMQVGAGYAVTDDIGVRATAFVAQFNPRAQLTSGGVGFTYRFIRGQFEMGVGLDWIYQTPTTVGAIESSGQDIIPSLPMAIHLGHVVRVDITPSLPISTAGIYIPYIGGIDNNKTTLGLDVPVAFRFQLFEPMHLDLITGVNMTFNPDSVEPGLTFGDFFGFPLGVDLGISVPSPRGPILDMTPYFVWPELLIPGVDGRLGVNAVQSGLWVAGMNITVYLYL